MNFLIEVEVSRRPWAAFRHQNNPVYRCPVFSGLQPHTPSRIFLPEGPQDSTEYLSVGFCGSFRRVALRRSSDARLLRTRCKNPRLEMVLSTEAAPSFALFKGWVRGIPPSENRRGWGSPKWSVVKSKIYAPCESVYEIIVTPTNCCFAENHPQQRS